MKISFVVCGVIISCSSVDGYQKQKFGFFFLVTQYCLMVACQGKYMHCDHDVVKSGTLL